MTYKVVQETWDKDYNITGRHTVAQYDTEIVAYTEAKERDKKSGYGCRYFVEKG